MVCGGGEGGGGDVVVSVLLLRGSAVLWLELPLSMKVTEGLATSEPARAVTGGWRYDWWSRCSLTDGWVPLFFVSLVPCLSFENLISLSNNY